MANSDFHMWSYWRDKYGYESAVRDYYPETLKKNTSVSYALSQIKAGRLLLDSVFEELAEEEGEDAS